MISPWLAVCTVWLCEAYCVFSIDAKLGLYEKKVADLEQELEGWKKRGGEEHQITCMRRRWLIWEQLKCLLGRRHCTSTIF